MFRWYVKRGWYAIQGQCGGQRHFAASPSIGCTFSTRSAISALCGSTAWANLRLLCVFVRCSTPTCRRAARPDAQGGVHLLRRASNRRPQPAANRVSPQNSTPLVIEGDMTEGVSGHAIRRSSSRAPRGDRCPAGRRPAPGSVRWPGRRPWRRRPFSAVRHRRRGHGGGE